MIPLNQVHDDLRTFGSASRPLRPSKIGKLLSCAMQIVLDMYDETPGGKAAQTGNLVHTAAEWYHKTTGVEEARVAAGLEALEKARDKFPAGDDTAARTIFAAYAADKENRDAEVVWAEAKVTLTMQADRGDPTGEPIVISGTLDQVRRDKNGVLRVWDIKTGTTYSGADNLLMATAQQAVYVLAARETLSKEIQVGGLIHTAGYAKVKGKVHLPLEMTVEDCDAVLSLVPAIVSQIRQGRPGYRPSVEACQWCSHKPWPKCRRSYGGLYG